MLAAGEIEGIARGHNQADHRLGDPHALELFHQARQQGFRVGDAEENQDLIEDVAAEFDEAETDAPGDGHQDDEHECQAGAVEHENEF